MIKSDTSYELTHRPVRFGNFKFYEDKEPIVDT